jgi:RES domain-containing protein
VAGAVVWRIAKRRYALDRSGTGARLGGGRWNNAGTAVIYAGRTIAIAALERFVHLAGIVPPDLVLVRIELPDDGPAEEPDVADLPRGWDVVPAGPASMQFGTTWASDSRSLVLYVPSVLVREERIAVLNPGHSAFTAVKMVIVRSFHYDPRLYGPRRPST